MSFGRNIRVECERILGKEWVKDAPVTLYTPLTVICPPTIASLNPGSLSCGININILGSVKSHLIFPAVAVFLGVYVIHQFNCLKFR